MISNTSQQMAQAMGFVSLYGNTPWVDMLEQHSLRSNTQAHVEQEEVHILLHCTGDIRHAWKTISNHINNFGALKRVNVRSEVTV